MINQTNNVLSIPNAASGRLGTYLSSVKIPMNNGSEIAASSIWTTYGDVGRQSALVAILKKGSSPGELYDLGELYQINAAPKASIPMVAVIVTGMSELDLWSELIVRAIGQTLGGLADEYELDGSDFASVPDGVWSPPPNVVFISDNQRGRLAGGESSRSVLPNLCYQWPIAKTDTLKFYPHNDPTPNPTTTPKGNGSIQLVEGGERYRKNALRCDFDCLMRRMPNSTQLPIQDQVSFCKVCQHILRGVISDSPDFNMQNAGRILLDSQHLLYDTVKWSSINKIDLKKQTFPLTFGPFGGGPKWSFDIEVNNTNGLKITNLRLSDRPGDPFAAATATAQAADVMQSIEFTDLTNPLSVTFESDPPTTLNIVDAMTNNLAPPHLEVATEGGTRKEFFVGIKLVLSWDIPDKWAIEVAMSLVLKGMKNDIDPGGAVMACKIYPQMSMRYRRPPKGSKKRKGKMPKVTALQGTIAFVTNNVIPTSLAGTLDPDLRSMANGKLAMSLFTDSNSSDWDSEYKFSTAFFASQFGGANVPEFKLWDADWSRGRKLAGVVHSSITSPSELGGATARKAHRDYGEPGLPHWSWLFDYSSPLLSGNKHFVAVYRDGDVTTSGNHNGGLPRDKVFPWPPPSDLTDPPPSTNPFQMKVSKVGRQGAYDNVHLHADMGTDDKGRPVVAAPFCADLCLHLHWRWGIVAIGVTRTPYSFLGWGNGKLDQGAHTIRGAPLIPPNQHLEIDITAQSNSEALVKYISVAYAPGLDEYQVFLEQGIGFAFTYDGLPIDDLVRLCAAVGVIGPTKMEEKKTELDGLLKSDPAKLDREKRMLFQHIYEKIRWYDTNLDKIKAGVDVQQVPGVPAAPADLEGL